MTLVSNCPKHELHKDSRKMVVSIAALMKYLFNLKACKRKLLSPHNFSMQSISHFSVAVSFSICVFQEPQNKSNKANGSVLAHNDEGASLLHLDVSSGFLSCFQLVFSCFCKYFLLANLYKEENFELFTYILQPYIAAFPF